MNTKSLIAFAPAVLATIISACGSRGTQSGSGPEQQATTSFAVSGGDFSGNSIRICGSRTPPADSKFRCDNSLSPADAGPSACPCFNFTADGNLIDPTTGQPVVITNLCPSVDLSAEAGAEADWTFTYSIFTSPDCKGAQLNNGKHNFTCFDSRDLASQANPNESVEPLNPGLNTNHIICTTMNASKTFNFLSCASSCDKPAPDGGACKLTRFDCGCTVTCPSDAGWGASDAGWGASDAGMAASCICDGEGGLTAGDLQAGCRFDPTTCDILCSP